MGDFAALLRSRFFTPLFLAQSFSVMADHLLRNAGLFAIVYVLSADRPGQASLWSNLAVAAFTLPYFLASSIAGTLVDQVDKALLVRRIMMADVAVMVLSALALWQGSGWLLILALLLAGTRATLFGPLKYAILPQHLAPGDRMLATGMIQASSFVAVVMGQLGGGILNVQASAIGLVLLALAAWAISLRIPPAPPEARGLALDFNLLRGTWRMVRDTLAEAQLRRAIASLSWFYVVGAILTGQFAAFARNELALERDQATILLLAFSSGVVCGSLIFGRLSRGRIQLRRAALAVTVMGLLLIDLAASAWIVPASSRPGGSVLSWRVLFDIFALAAAAAAYALPHQAVLQSAGPADRRGRDLSANNIVNAALVVLGLACASVLQGLGSDIASLFALCGVLSILVGAFEWITLARVHPNG